MKITKVLFFSALFLLAAATASAQRGEDRDPARMAERQSEHLATVLDLTPEQTEGVRALNLAFAERLAAGREEFEEDRKARRKQLEAANESRKAGMKEILTPEQYAKLEALAAQRKERRGDRDGKRRGRKPRG